jgi:hypothetical protein
MAHVASTLEQPHRHTRSTDLRPQPTKAAKAVSVLGCRLLGQNGKKCDGISKFVALDRTVSCARNRFADCV